MLDPNLLELIEGDCGQRLSGIPNNSIDLIVTSPPYAEQRKGKYEGTPVSEYVNWFLPIAVELKRILKPSGSFFLNLKAHCEKQERSLYVMELVLKLRNEVGFKFVDEYVWYKSAAPRKKTFRLKNSWEPIYHFSLGKNFINHDAIKVESDCTFGNKRGYTTYNETTGNIGGYHDIADQKSGWTDPGNVLYFPTSLLVKDKFPHPAKFPRELVEFLIKGFCPENGTVCDPFVGSGMTALAALVLKRKCIAVEISSEYCKMVRKRIDTYTPVSIPRKIKYSYIDMFGNKIYPTLGRK